MALSILIFQDCGPATGSPPRGTTRGVCITAGFTNGVCYWKSLDDRTTINRAAPIDPGTNSYDQFIWGQYSGSYNTLSFGEFLGIPVAGEVPIPTLTINGNCTSTYTTPSRTANTMLNINQGYGTFNSQVITFGTEPQLATNPSVTVADAPTPTTCYLITQLLVGALASLGDTPPRNFRIDWQET